MRERKGWKNVKRRSRTRRNGQRKEQIERTNPDRLSFDSPSSGWKGERTDAKGQLAPIVGFDQLLMK